MMSKKLLVEYVPFKPVGSLNESNGAAYGIPGGFVVQGVLQRAGAKNQNGLFKIVNDITILFQESFQKEGLDYFVVVVFDCK